MKDATKSLVNDLTSNPNARASDEKKIISSLPFSFSSIKKEAGAAREMAANQRNVSYEAISRAHTKILTSKMDSKLLRF